MLRSRTREEPPRATTLPANVLAQSHALSLRTGTNTKSARVGMTLTTLGAFIPGASSQQLTANGGLRFVRSRGVVNSTFRFFAQDARTPTSPVLAGLDPMLLDSSDRQSVRQFTVGANATFARDDRWTHSAVAGVDGYKLKSAAILDGAFPSAIRFCSACCNRQCISHNASREQCRPVRRSCETRCDRDARCRTFLRAR